MKTRFTIVVFFVFIAATGFAQMDLFPVRLAGVIYASDTSQKTPFVHIINRRTGTGTISDSIGYFKTTLLKTDTLLLQCIGFKDRYFTLSDTLYSTILFVEIRLTETSYFLDVVDIYALSRLNQFKYDFINMPLADDGWENGMIIPGVSRKEYKWIRDDEKVLGIQPLWNPFSNMKKSERDLLELINNETGNRIIDEKYNLEILSLVSGFKGDTLIDLRLFLNYSRSYLLSNDVYQIITDIKSKLPEFKKNYVKEEKSVGSRQ